MTIPMKVSKTHASGNDFIVYADPKGEYDPEELEVKVLCDRHFGVGGDGVIRLVPVQYVRDLDPAIVQECEEKGAEWFMDYRNADGSIAEMCGNGTRAISLFALRNEYISLVQGDSYPLGTRAGVKVIKFLDDYEPTGKNSFQVNLGAYQCGELDEYTVTLPGEDGAAAGTFVDMGNPHVVVPVEEESSTLSDLTMLKLNAQPLVSPVLSQGQNVEFVRVDKVDVDQNFGEATMRVYERGVGETLSCGTGLGATAVVLREKTGISNWRITVPGGVLLIEVHDDEVILTGSAMLVSNIELL
ncbi:MAG: diaminopimelate epimerase [Bifidobacteriaceae bacterium]|nr:diaminopimelate epimerase [Bifidobacteriaceae bacterium]